MRLSLSRLVRVTALICLPAFFAASSAVAEPKTAASPAPPAEKTPATTQAPRQAPHAAGPPAAPVYYAVRLVPGPNWVEGGVEALTNLPEFPAHSAYMETLFANELLVMGGPLLDGHGGVIVLEVPSIAEAKRIMDAEPFTRAGVWVPEISPWLVVLMRR